MELKEGGRERGRASAPGLDRAPQGEAGQTQKE